MQLSMEVYSKFTKIYYFTIDDGFIYIIVG